jgi:DNA-binding NarL/FixJ family response regulator
MMLFTGNREVFPLEMCVCKPDIVLNVYHMNDASSKLQVIIIDDCETCRLGTFTFLSQEFSVVKDTNDYITFNKWVQEDKPDVVIFGANTFTSQEVEALVGFINEHPTIPVITITAIQDEQLFSRMLNAGVKGFLSRTVSRIELLEAARKVAQDEHFYSMDIIRQLRVIICNKQFSHLQSAPTIVLTESEITLIKFLCAGYTLSQIAMELKTSYHTLASRKHFLYQKLNLRNKAELIQYAISNGLFKNSINL